MNVLAPIIWCTAICCHVSTGIRVKRLSSSTKPYSGITRIAYYLIVANKTNPCFGVIAPKANDIETFLITVLLERGLGTDQLLPFVTTEWGAAILPSSDQRVQRVSYLVYDEKIDILLSKDPHSETDLSEGCVPVGCQFGLLCVKYSLSSCNIKCSLVSPKDWMVMKCTLREKKKISRINFTVTLFTI